MSRKEPYGESWYKQMAAMGRNWLGLQHMRIACGARIRHLREEGQSGELIRIQQDYLKILTKDEKTLLKEIQTQAENHKLKEYCDAVRGLGPMALATFLSYINPYKATTGGKARAYVGMIPGVRLQAGVKAKINPTAKGRFHVVTKNVLMAKDDFYTAIYQTKKDYYVRERMGPFLENPKLCPDYEECLKRLKTAAAKRAERGEKEVDIKKPSCKAHIDNRAKRYLAGIIISHATQIMREQEGLCVDSFYTHRGYIAPPPLEPKKAATKPKLSKKAKEEMRLNGKTPRGRDRAKNAGIQKDAAN